MQSDVPELTPAYVAQPPRIDGRLDDPCWQQVTPLANFILTTKPEPAEKQTIVRAVCTRTALYFAFECLESDMDKLVTRYTEDGQPIWQDDCIEIFISPYAIARRDNFHHFVVNAAGARTRLYAEAVRENGSWEAAVDRRADRWIAEVAIPFSELKPAGKNEDCWRVNFGRETRTSNETSSLSPVPKWFATPWRFGRLLQPPQGPKFLTLRCKISPAPASPGQTGARTVAQVPLPTQSVRPVIPQPREVRWRKLGPFVINARTKILIGARADAADRRAAEEINQEISRLLGYELQIERAGAEGPASNALVVGERSLNPLADWIAEQDRLPAEHHPEGYILDVSPERIVISGADQVGTFWGAQTLRELIRPEGRAGVVNAVFIRDWPEFRFRGVHLLAQKDALRFHTKLIEQVLSRFKINHIVLQTDKIDWQSHPEVRDPDNYMPKADVRRLLQVETGMVPCRAG